MPTLQVSVALVLGTSAATDPQFRKIDKTPINPPSIYVELNRNALPEPTDMRFPENLCTESLICLLKIIGLKIWEVDR